jgi:RNA polymerase sigma-70 factor (ECF subfamily)
MAREDQLVVRAAAGDSAAFDALVEACRPWLFGLCFRLVHDRDTADDLVQETLMAAFRGICQLRDPSSFRPWLGRIAVNTCRMHLRRVSAAGETVALSDAIAAPHSDPCDSTPAVGEALARVDSASRRVLILLYADGLSYAEVAETLSLSIPAAKSRLHRARERLRKEMMTMMTPEEKGRLGVSAEAPWALRTVLLVEPDDELRAPLQEAIAAAGYEVVALPTGEAALEAVKAKRGQMLILDTRCVEPNWVEALTLLQGDAWARENVPVAVLIDRSERDVLLAWQAGVAVCLTRPFHIDELVEYVCRMARLWPEELRPGPTEPASG